MTNFGRDKQRHTNLQNIKIFHILINARINTATLPVTNIFKGVIAAQVYSKKRGYAKSRV